MRPDQARPTATIYQFPQRPGLRVLHQRADSATVCDIRARRPATIDAGSAWYHDREIGSERDLPKN